MAHIQLPEGLPGIRGAMAFRPETARPLNDLVEVLLHAPNSLTPGERDVAVDSKLETSLRALHARLVK